MEERTVGDMISRSAPLSVGPSTTVRDAARLMHEHKCGSVLVMEEGRLVGIFTERDALWRVAAAPLDPATTPVAAVMTRDPDTLPADAPVADALRLMDECGFWHVPVTREGEVVGVVSIRDLPIGGGIGLQDELDRRHDLAERML
jgi:CBS domain-containing protein